MLTRWLTSLWIAVLVAASLALVNAAVALEPFEMQELSFFATNPGFYGGVQVGLCADARTAQRVLVLGAGPGIGSGWVFVYIHAPTQPWRLFYSWYPYGVQWTGGVSVGCAILDDQLSVSTGAGPGGGAHVILWRFPLLQN